MELNDIYDENRNLTGKLHRRGTPWKPGEYGVVVCVWVYDGRGHLLLTRRADGDVVQLAANFSGEPAEVAVDAAYLDLLHTHVDAPAAVGDGVVKLPAWGYAVLG